LLKGVRLVFESRPSSFVVLLGLFLFFLVDVLVLGVLFETGVLIDGLDQALA